MRVWINLVYATCFSVYTDTVKRGPKPQGKTSTKWTNDFAYAIGLLTADGCLSRDGRHVNFTSVDNELVNNFTSALKIQTKPRTKLSGAGNSSFYVQFSDVLFYSFLLRIGLKPAKSKTLGKLMIPRKYFSHFLRGYFDGDGSSYSYFDPYYPDSFRFYISFTSASPDFLTWLRAELNILFGVRGYMSRNRNNSYVQLKYAKRDAVVLAKVMYAAKGTYCLPRKYLKISQTLDIIG